VAASLRLSRGFHRLAVLLAAIPLLVGSAYSFTIALAEANGAKSIHDRQVKLACAQKELAPEGVASPLHLPSLSPSLVWSGR
jgi:hypothetical protein